MDGKIAQFRFVRFRAGWLKNISAAIMAVIYVIPVIMDVINIDIVDDYFHGEFALLHIQISTNRAVYKTQIMGILPVIWLFLPIGKLCIFGDMETAANPSSNIGRKISRIRELRNIKQETLAFELGLSQQSISRMEQSDVLEDDVLEKIALVLGVTPDAIKNFSEEGVINYFNTFNDHSFNNGAYNAFGCNFNPIEKWMEVVEENKKLFTEKVALLERLLQAEKEKNELLKSK